MAKKKATAATDQVEGPPSGRGALPPVRGGLQELWVDELRPWPGNRDLGELDELVASVKAQGVLQPILVRPNPGDEATFQVVAGHRRVEAARRAGLDRVPALVRDLDERQALEIQLVENLQRRDLHPLEEAEGYQQLMEKHGHSAESLAARVGRSKAYVYARLKLLELGKGARKAFVDGKLDASVAVLLARVPAPLQADALEMVLDCSYEPDAPPSYREAADVLRTNFMLRLDQAPFDRADPELVPEAGACGPCPRRTGNQPDLFEDVRSKELCMDPPCFRRKREAHAARLEAAAREEGRKVLTGKAAAAAARGEGFVRVDEETWDLGLEGKVPRKVLKKHLPPPVVALSDGSAVEVLPRKELEAALKAAGFKATKSSQGMPDQAEQRRKAKEKRRAGRAMVEACLEAARTSDLDVLDPLLFAHVVEESDHEVAKRVAEARGLGGRSRHAPGGQIDGPREALQKLLPTLGHEDARLLALEIVFEAGTTGNWDERRARPSLEAAMKALGVDARAAVQAAKKAATEAGKAKKKGAARGKA